MASDETRAPAVTPRPRYPRQPGPSDPSGDPHALSWFSSRGGRGGVCASGRSVARVVAAGTVAIAALARTAPSAAVIAGRVEKQPTATIVVAASQTVSGHRLDKVEPVERENPREIVQTARLKDPSGRRAGEAAGGDRVGERAVQRGADLDLSLAAGMVDAVGEVPVQQLTELAHSAQHRFSRRGVVADGEAHRCELLLVNDRGAVGPGQQIERYAEVLSPSAGVMTPGHGVDEIERRVAADQVDRSGP
jgi:hypothetical protein